MKEALFVALCFILTACGSQEFTEQDGSVVCSVDGRAYFVKSHMGNTSVVRRSSSADPLCLPMKKEQPQ